MHLKTVILHCPPSPTPHHSEKVLKSLHYTGPSQKINILFWAFWDFTCSIEIVVEKCKYRSNFHSIFQIFAQFVKVFSLIKSYNCPMLFTWVLLHIKIFYPFIGIFGFFWKHFKFSLPLRVSRSPNPISSWYPAPVLVWTDEIWEII